jgi:DNA polymerase/3'-5' exonuclease PolX
MQASTTLSILINTIRDSADGWRNRLLGLNAVSDCITAGSIRRWCDAIERIDLAVSTCAIEEVLDFAAAQPDVETILAREKNACCCG